MHFLRLWRTIVSYQGMIIFLALVSALTATLVTYMLPQVYEASALVLVRPTKEIRISQNPSRSPEVLDFPVSHAAPIDAPSKTYMEVIKSRSVAEKIVESLGLHLSKPQVYESYWEEVKEIAKTHIKEIIRSTKHIFKYGRVIPATLYERAVEEVEENLSLDVARNTYAFTISFKSSKPREAADVANKAAEIFLVHNDEAYKTEAKKVRAFLEGRLRERVEELNQTRQNLLNYKRAIDTFSLDEEYTEKLKILSNLESDLEKTEVKLAGLLQNYNSNHLAVQSLQAERNRLLQALTLRKKELKEHPNKEKRLEELKLQVTVAEKSYSSMLEEYEDARIQEAKSLDEIRIVSYAVAPLYPLKPRKYIYGGGGFLLGLVLGVALVFFLENINPRVRCMEDVTEALALRVLATIPETKTLPGK